MIVISGVLPELKQTFAHIDTVSWYPFTCPFRLVVDGNNFGATNSVNQGQKFVKNQKFCDSEWLWGLASQALVTIAAAYRFIQEDETFLAKTLDAWKVWIFSYFTVYSFIQKNKAKDVTQFWNELANLEIRHVSNNLDGEHFAQVRGRYKKLLLSVWLLRWSILSNRFFFVASALVWPSAPWNILPNSFINSLEELSWITPGWTGIVINILLKILSRCVCAVITYCVWAVAGNLAFVNINLNILVPTFCLQFTSELLWRKMSTSPLPGNIVPIARLYREIQLICWRYNETHKRTFVLGFVILVPVCCSITVFVLVSRGNELDPAAIMVFINYTFCGVFFMLFGFQSAAKVFAESQKLIAGLLWRAGTILQTCQCNFEGGKETNKKGLQISS